MTSCGLGAVRMDKRNKIKKLKTDIKYLVKKIELWLAFIENTEKKIQEKTNKIIEMENENE
jgi:hypothetical protein